MVTRIKRNCTAASRSEEASADRMEMRGLAPVALVQALDAYAYANEMNRNDYVVAVLEKHIRFELHKDSLKENMLKGNPLRMESDRRVL